ncbi:MAG: SDR family oxidoreductase [Anaerolineaceae bacterium]|nr:SDR family oxidoreductase [Anaerolineaceae bacterium]
MSLGGKTILITGAARRIGRHLALAAAHAGANVVLHHSHSPKAALETVQEIEQLGRKAWILEADFVYPEEAEKLVQRAAALTNLYAIVHNAAIFEPLGMLDTSLDDWQRHMNINLTAPFLLSREFAKVIRQSIVKAEVPQPLPGEQPMGRVWGRMVTILDWRALRPQEDHFPYTISKAALAALTQSMAVACAPHITVNGLALGAILPPSDGADAAGMIKATPAGRWAEMDEVGQALLFLLDGPEYITGEILHLDGGRHLI